MPQADDKDKCYREAGPRCEKLKARKGLGLEQKPFSEKAQKFRNHFVPHFRCGWKHPQAFLLPGGKLAAKIPHFVKQSVGGSTEVSSSSNKGGCGEVGGTEYSYVKPALFL